MTEIQKLKAIIRCFDMWFSARENNCFIGSYLQKLNIKVVGIYGYGRLGKHLLAELMDSEIEVKWVMDQRDVSEQVSCHYVDPDAAAIPLDIDMVINTTLGSIEEVEKKFIELGFNKVVSIEEILEETRYQNML